MWEISMQDTKKKLSDISPPAETLDDLPERRHQIQPDECRPDSEKYPDCRQQKHRQMFYDLYAQKIELKIQSEELQRMQGPEKWGETEDSL